MESFVVWFEDFGSGVLYGDVAPIEIDPLFLETVTVSENVPFMVLVTPTSDCNGLYVNKLVSSFEVVELCGGDSNATFDYRIVAKRKGFETVDLQVSPKNRHLAFIMTETLGTTNERQYLFSFFTEIERQRLLESLSFFFDRCRS